MSLPKSVVPAREVTFESGEKLLVRGFSRAEMHRVSALSADTLAAEAASIAIGCGVSEDDARSWLETANQADADLLLTAILELSGLGDGQGKS